MEVKLLLRVPDFPPLLVAESVGATWSADEVEIQSGQAVGRLLVSQGQYVMVVRLVTVTVDSTSSCDA